MEQVRTDTGKSENNTTIYGFGGTDMSENKKALRILSGIFLMISFGFSIGTSAVALVNTVKWWNGLNEENLAPVIRSYLRSAVPGWVLAVFLLLTAIFILMRKFKIAGILQLLSGAYNLITASVSMISLLVLSISSGGANPSAGLMYIFNFLGAAAVLLFAVALLIQGNHGNLLCILAAVIGIISACFSTVFSSLGSGLELSNSVRIIGTNLLTAAVPMIMLFLSRLFLGNYFGANLKKNS